MKFIQLNIERNKHLEAVMSFVQEEAPEVVFLQEVMQESVPALRAAWGMHAAYAPMSQVFGFEDVRDGDIIGVALLSRTPLVDVSATIYAHGTTNDEHTLPHVVHGDDTTYAAGLHRVLLTAVHPENGIRCGTTHFTWSPDGSVTELQRTHLDALHGMVAGCSDILLCGDFNIPRGNELYTSLCHSLTDHIPRDIESSLDPVLHRAGHKRLMVDYVWTRGRYRVDHVRMVTGVSDHAAFVGEVSVV